MLSLAKNKLQAQALSFFWLVVSRKILQQQLSLKYSLIMRYQKMSQKFPYINIRNKEKKIRTRVQMKDIKLKFLKGLFLRYKRRYFCCNLQNKIIENPCLQNDKTFMRLQPAKSVLFDWMALWKFLYFIIRFSQGQTDKVSDTSLNVIFIIRRAIVLWVIWKHFALLFIKNN